MVALVNHMPTRFVAGQDVLPSMDIAPKGA